MSVSLGHYIWPFQEPDQLLTLSQILGLTFLSNLLIPTSASYPFSICLSFLLRAKACQRKTLSLIMCVYNSQNNGVLISETSNEVTCQTKEILW